MNNWTHNEKLSLIGMCIFSKLFTWAETYNLKFHPSANCPFAYQSDELQDEWKALIEKTLRSGQKTQVPKLSCDATPVSVDPPAP